MNQDIEKYHEMLDTLKLTRPIPLEVQERSLKSGRKNLRAILKKTGYYSAFFGIVLTIFYWLRNLGIKSTLFKSKVIFFIVSANVVTSAVIGINYIAANYLFDKIEEQVIEQKKTPIIQDRAKPSIHRTEIGIEPFEGEREVSQKVTSAIAKVIVKDIGSSKVAFLKLKERERAVKAVIGSVTTFGDTSYITARIVNVDDSNVDYVTSEEYKSDEDIERACNSIAQRLVDKLKEPK